MTDAVSVEREEARAECPIVGRSAALRRALGLAERFAPTGLSILLVGPTGTGKELFARHIHALSGRRGRLVAVNCGALPRDVVESLLFGHCRGAFTGAVTDRVGYVEAAVQGTLFLDELASLTPEMQAKLLRTLETREVTRVGETAPRAVDFRVAGAVQPDIRARVERGAFRLDLYQRLAGLVLELPPLWQRPEDLVPIAEQVAASHGRILAPGVNAVLWNYSWPGNGRELRLAIERAVWLTPDSALSPTVVAEAIALGTTGDDDGRSAREAERAELLAVCAREGYDARRIAQARGIGRTALFDELKALGLSLRGLRKSAKAANVRGRSGLSGTAPGGAKP